MQTQYDKIQVYINQDIKSTKDEQARIKKRQEEAQAEIDRQEKEGVVTKPVKIGRKAYRMRKTDF